MVGWRWRPAHAEPVAALVFEARDSAFAPLMPCLRDPERSPRFPDVCWHDECADKAFYNEGALPVVPQADAMIAWLDGEFGDPRPPVLLWDFDHVVRRVFGLAGRTSYYLQGQVWSRARPRVGEALQAIRSDPRTRVLVPYPPAGTVLERRYRKRYEDEAWEPRYVSWTYPEQLEVSELTSPHERSYDAVYTGSDYDRRRRFSHYYVELSDRGHRVAVTGIWGDRRGGRESPPWNVKGFRSWLERETSVEFLSPSAYRQLRFEDAMAALSDARISVQVTTDEYAKLGYYTNRWAEIWARGTLGFMDPEIQYVDRYVHPSLRGHLVIDDVDRVSTAIARLREGPAQGWFYDFVELQRAHLRELCGPAAQAERLLDIAAGT